VRHASTFLGLISKALRANYDKVADEPLPERWVELIHHLSRGTNLRRRRSLRVGRDARTRQPTTTRRYLGSPTPGRRRGVPVLGKVGRHPAPGALPSYFYPSSCSVGDLFLGRRGDRMRHAVPAVSPAPQAPGGSSGRHDRPGSSAHHALHCSSLPPACGTGRVAQSCQVIMQRRPISRTQRSRRRVFAWCGDAPSCLRQPRSRKIPRIGVSVLTKHVELPIKRSIPQPGKHCRKSPQPTRNSSRTQRQSSLPAFPSDG